MSTDFHFAIVAPVEWPAQSNDDYQLARVRAIAEFVVSQTGELGAMLQGYLLGEVNLAGIPAEDVARYENISGEVRRMRKAGEELYERYYDGNDHVRKALASTLRLIGLAELHLSRVVDDSDFSRLFPHLIPERIANARNDHGRAGNKILRFLNRKGRKVVHKEKENLSEDVVAGTRDSPTAVTSVSFVDDVPTTAGESVQSQSAVDSPQSNITVVPNARSPQETSTPLDQNCSEAQAPIESTQPPVVSQEQVSALALNITRPQVISCTPAWPTLPTSAESTDGLPYPKCCETCPMYPKRPNSNR